MAMTDFQEYVVKLKTHVMMQDKHSDETQDFEFLSVIPCSHYHD